MLTSRATCICGSVCSDVYTCQTVVCVCVPAGEAVGYGDVADSCAGAGEAAEAASELCD